MNSTQISQTIPLENRAWRGTRCYLHQDVADQYPFQIELGYHVGKQAYMIVIYHYDPESPYYAQRFSRAEISSARKTLFGPNPIQLLEEAEKIIQEYYGRPDIFFQKDLTVIFL